MQPWLVRRLAPRGVNVDELLSALAIGSTRLCTNGNHPPRMNIWYGALGDPFIVQMDITVPRVEDTQTVADVLRVLGSQAAHVQTLLDVLAPIMWLATGTDNTARLRVALPRNTDDLLDEHHCQRIAAVAFSEALEDQYTALVDRAQPTLSIAALSECTGITIALHQHTTAQRQAFRRCLGETVQRAASWHDVPLAAARCNAQRRVQRTDPLLDAFVPSAVANADGSVLITHALLREPWSSPTMSTQSVAARLAWTIARASANVQVPAMPGEQQCETTRRRDEWATSRAEQCAGDSVDSLFWLELVQMHCGLTEPCKTRWTDALASRALFDRAFSCRNR